MAEKTVSFVLDMDESDLIEGLKEAGVAVNVFTKNTQKATKGSTMAWASFVGNVAASGFTKVMSVATDAVVTFGSTAIEQAQNLEDLSIRFETLTGSAEEAAVLMQQLADFAASTPFQLEGIANTSAQLISFGFEVDSITGRLQRIGDVAAATGSDLGELGLIYGQIGAAGKLTGERLLQLQERGVPILAALGDQMGKTQAEVRELVTKGKVDFETFEKAFNGLSDQGGIAFESMIKQSKTFSGVMSTLKDNFNLFAAGIGQALLPVLKSVAIQLTAFIQGLDKNAVKNFIVDGLVQLSNTLVDVAENINPIVNSFRLVWRVGHTIISSLQTGFWTLETAIAGVVNGITQSISGLINFLPDSLVPDGWKESLNRVSEATEEVMNEMGEKLVESAQETREILDETLNTFNEKVVSEETKDAIISNIQTIRDEAVQANADIQASTEKANKAKLKSEQDTNKQIKKEKSALKKFDEWANSERGKNFQSTLNTISTLSKSKNKELAAIGKAAAVSQATIDGILAVQKALASAPPPFNFALAGLVGVATAANVANIVSAPVGFQTGGVIGDGTTSGDQTLIRANRKERVLTARQNASFEDAVDLATNGGGFGATIQTEALIQLNETLENKEFGVNIDGERLNDELQDINERSLI